MQKFLTGLLKAIIYTCFLAALAGFSGLVTVRVIFATGSVEVPAIEGKEVEYATDLLAERHLRLKVVDQQLHSKIPADHVLAQDPPAGVKVNKNRTVRIVLSKGVETTTVPDLTGKTWQEAKRLLRQGSFRVGRIASAHSTEAPVDTVMTQTPLPHSQISAGESIDVLVSRGPYRKTMVMPDLVERQLSDALEVINKLGLVKGKIVHEQYEGVPPNTIISHIPKPGALIEEQNIVTFVVSGTPGAGSLAPGQTSEAVHYQTVEYTVPPGPIDREIAVLVKNREGTTEMYRQLVPPGKLIMIRVPVAGETIVEVYVDGTLDIIERL